MRTMYLLPMMLIILQSPIYLARPQNVNISQSGNIRISTINGVFSCGEMICPSNSVKCSVSKESTNDLLNIETLKRCHDVNGATTKEEKSTEPNPHPGTRISDYSEASRSGSNVIQHINHGNGNASIGPNEDFIQKQMEEWQQKFQEEMSTFHVNLENEILQNIQKTFQNSIPKWN